MLNRIRQRLRKAGSKAAAFATHYGFPVGKEGRRPYVFGRGEDFFLSSKCFRKALLFLTDPMNSAREKQMLAREWSNAFRETPIIAPSLDANYRLTSIQALKLLEMAKDNVPRKDVLNEMKRLYRLYAK